MSVTDSRDPKQNKLGHQWRQQEDKYGFIFCDWCRERQDFAEAHEECRAGVIVKFKDKEPRWFSRWELKDGTYETKT